MNKHYLILILILLVLFGISGIIIAENFKESIKINGEKTLINLSFEFSPIYVSDLTKLYPDITTVTHNNGTHEIGYVNVFGGIGENFVVSQNKLYEITSKQEVNLDLR